jgi:hypothetical protein
MKRIYLFHAYSMAAKYLAIIKVLFKKCDMARLQREIPEK